MSLIDITHFFNEFEIAQKSQASVSERINEYIDNYETEFIEKAIGEDFAALFNARTDDGRFNELESMLKKNPSPIAGYVFYHYQRDSISAAGGIGDSRGKSENSERTPEVYRMVKAWNIMAAKTTEIRRYLHKNRETFPEFDLYDTDYYLTVKINEFGL